MCVCVYMYVYIIAKIHKELNWKARKESDYTVCKGPSAAGPDSIQRLQKVRLTRALNTQWAMLASTTDSSHCLDLVLWNQSLVLIPGLNTTVMDLSLASYRISHPPPGVFWVTPVHLELGGLRWSKAEELEKDNVYSCLELSFHILIRQVTIDWDIQ